MLTSAGVACTGNPPCIITTAGVSCATGCALTSVGLLCPGGGEVLPARAMGTVVPAPPVSRPGRRPPPSGEVKGVQVVSAPPPAAGAPLAHTAEEASGGDRGDLPFTGAPLGPLLALGVSLGLGGVLLRRRQWRAATVIAPDGEPAPPTTAPARQPLPGRPARRRPFVGPALLVVACGILTRRRTGARRPRGARGAPR